MTTKKQNIQYQLDEWKKEYGLTQPINFLGWDDLDKSGEWVLGRCTMYSHPFMCDIQLGIKWKKRKLGWLEMSTLWHEFCHANAFLEDGVNDSHNKHFKAYRRRKPKYWIGDMINNLVYSFL